MLGRRKRPRWEIPNIHQTAPLRTAPSIPPPPPPPLPPPLQTPRENTTNDLRTNARNNALPPPNATGQNHFLKYRSSINAPARMDFNEDIVQVMIEFWEYLKINSDVNTAKTLGVYMSNVKMWQLYQHEKDGTPNTRFPKWPLPSQNDELAKRLKDADKFFHEFGAKKGEKRIPLTDGLLNMLQPHLPGSEHMKREIFDCLLHTKLTGNRMGEITATKKSTHHSRFLTVSKVKIHSRQVDFTTLSKSMTPKPELTYVKTSEVSPLVTKYGAKWNFVTSTKKRIAGKKQTDPLYTDDQGRPLTYQDVYKALRIACKAIGLHPGLVGCHSGRIYMATLLAYKGATVPEIMKRGRWKSDAWQVYVNALTKYAKDAGADPNAFKIGDLAIPLDKYPEHNEFIRC